MGKKFLLSAILASLLLEGSSTIEFSSIKAPIEMIENNATKSIISANNEVIITFKDDTNMTKVSNDLKSMFASYTKKEYSLIKAIHLKVPSMATDAIKSMLEKGPFKDKIKTVEPNYAYGLNEASNDSYYSKLWAIENTGQDVNGKSGTNDADMDIKEAWNISKGSSDVVVAVLDTGVDYTHNDLADNMWNGDTHHGYDFAGDNNGKNDNDPMPDQKYDENGHYHGTHVAGIIGAVGDNSLGVSGVVQNVKIMAIKVFRPNGYGYSSDILEGLDYVSQQIDKGVNVVAINASYGGSGGSQGDSMDQAIQKLGDKGVVFCAAAGNEGKDIDQDPIYPASYSATNIITVAATDQDDKLASFSNYGKDSVEVAAPGTNILSTYPDNQYAYLQGTSMATPNVTGTVALLKSINPNSSVDDIIDAIEDNVDVKSSLNNKVSTKGRVNSYKAAKSVQNENSAPSANDDSATTEYETKVTIDATANDNDADGDSLSITSVSAPSHGSAVINNNKVDYTPESGFSGNDSFSYAISDGNGGEDSAKITVTVKEKLNSAPKANDDSARVDEDRSITIDVIKNDSDIDGDSLSIKSVSNPAHGKAEIKDGKIVYTPNANYNGSDSFSYTISDGNGGEDSANISITVNAINDDPEANDDSANTDEDRSITIDVIKNDSDIDGDSLSIKSVSNPAHGKAEIKDGKIVYTPNANYNGSDNFSYTISDGNDGEASANVSVTINAVNDAPEANDDSANTEYESTVNIDVLGNDKDIENDSLTIKSVSTPSHGKAEIKGNKIEYTPESGFSGNDSFSYTISDGNGGEDSAKVTITVNNKDNSAPVANDDSATTEYETKVTIDATANDSDADGDNLIIKSVSNPSHGKAEIKGNKIEYTPESGFSGNDSFSYTIDDENGGEATAKVTVTIKDQTQVPNHNPKAKNDSATTDYETKVTINAIANDSDADGDSLSIISVSTPSHGKVEIKNNKIQYSPESGFSGNDSFSYKISDGRGGEDSAQVTVKVKDKPADQNHIPKLNFKNTFYIGQNSSKEIKVTNYASDSDGDELNIKTVTQPANGQVIILSKDTIKYLPKPNFKGLDSFEVTIVDEKGATAKTTVKIMVKAEAPEKPDVHSFPIIDKDGTEIPTKIIGKFKNIIDKGNYKVLKIEDSQAEIIVNKESGEVAFNKINAPIPDSKLPAGTTVKLEGNKLTTTFTLKSKIKFK